jgi:hypothetical protein
MMIRFWTADTAFFEALLRKAPQDEVTLMPHQTFLILRSGAQRRGSKDAIGWRPICP